jgi:hypothetical protein
LLTNETPTRTQIQTGKSNLWRGLKIFSRKAKHSSGMGKMDRCTEQEKPSDRTGNQNGQDDAGHRAVKSKDRTKVACRQPGPSLLHASKNRSENKGMAHTTTGKNRNTCSVSNRPDRRRFWRRKGSSRGGTAARTNERRKIRRPGKKSIAEDESCAQNENQPRLGPDQKQLRGAEGKALVNKPSRTEQEEWQRFTRERL